MALLDYNIASEYIEDENTLAILKGPFDKPSAFKSSTLLFIERCKRCPEEKYDIRTISEEMGFRQRRFYEVVNVFEALGICLKIDSDSFVWIGFEQIKETLERIATERCAFYSNVTLDQIFQNKGCISVQRITEEFLLLFIALEMRRIKILEAATYLSRENDREKTTRCKLYQVAAILEIANIIKKTDQPSEFEIMPEYFISASDRINKKSPDPNSLISLLNRPEPFCSNPVSPTILSRVHEYYSTNL